MSYDLAFWSEPAGTRRLPDRVFEALTNGDSVEGLVDLPIDEILALIIEEFPSTVREFNGPQEWVVWVSANEKDSFQVTWTPQYFLINCRHLHTDSINRLIDIAAAFECPPYDPQIHERFEIPK